MTGTAFITSFDVPHVRALGDVLVGDGTASVLEYEPCAVPVLRPEQAVNGRGVLTAPPADIRTPVVFILRDAGDRTVERLEDDGAPIPAGTAHIRQRLGASIDLLDVLDFEFVLIKRQSSRSDQTDLPDRCGRHGRWR